VISRYRVDLVAFCIYLKFEKKIRTSGAFVKGGRTKRDAPYGDGARHKAFGIWLKSSFFRPKPCA
jgi:hypothetical protein